MRPTRAAVKLALIADIHANLPALQVVLADVDAWRPDLVVVLGDIVNRGPHPRECHELIGARAGAAGWRLLAGNHEEYVLHVHREPAAPGTAAFAMNQHAHWTAGQLAGVVGAVGRAARASRSRLCRTSRPRVLRPRLAARQPRWHLPRNGRRRPGRQGRWRRAAVRRRPHAPAADSRPERHPGGECGFGGVAVRWRPASRLCARRGRPERLAGYHSPPRLRLAADAR